MKQFLHIIKYKFISFIRLDTKLNIASIAKSLGSGIIYAAFAIGSFFFAKMLIQFLLIEVTIGTFLLHEFLSMVLFIFFLSINIGNIIVSYSTLYKANEINFLFTKPIEPARVFVIKFLDNFFYSSSTLLLILLSFLLGYVDYFNLSFFSTILLLLNFVPFMLSAGLLGVIILLLLIHAVDKWGIRKVFYLVCGSYLTVLILFFRINSPKNLVLTVLKFYPYFSKDIYLGKLISPFIKVLPNNWLAQTAYWLINRKDDFAIYYTILQVCLTIFLFIIAYHLGKKYYFKTWLLNIKIISELSSKRKEIGSFTSNKKSIFGAKSESIIKKDLLLFFREPSQVIHFFVLFFLIVIFITSVAGIKFIGLGNFYLQTMIYLAIFLFNLLLVSTLSLRFIFPLISLEGQAFWKIKSAPVNPKQFILSKLVVFSLVVLVISSALSIISNIKFGIVLLSFSLIVSFLSTLAIISINFGMGSFFSNYKEKNPIRISSSQGASLSFLLNLVYLLFLVILLFQPLSDLFLSIMINRKFHLVRLFWELLPVAIISLLISLFFMWLAHKALQKDF